MMRCSVSHSLGEKNELKTLILALEKKIELKRIKDEDRQKEKGRIDKIKKHIKEVISLEKQEKWADAIISLNSYRSAAKPGDEDFLPEGVSLVLWKTDLEEKQLEFQDFQKLLEDCKKLNDDFLTI